MVEQPVPKDEQPAPKVGAAERQRASEVEAKANQTAQERAQQEDEKNRLVSAEKCLGVAARQTWAIGLKQIPATVIDKGVLRHVPYMSFRASNYEVNIYGDPIRPAGLEIGIHQSLLRSQPAKAQCVEFMATLLNHPADRALLKSLKLTEDKQTRNGLTFEVTPETAEDAYGGWWVSVYDERALDRSRASQRELAEITFPRLAGQFIGRWRIVDEKGRTACYFTLAGSLDARKSHVPDASGKWDVVGDEARITWSDGWKDILRPQKDGVLKIAFGPGTSWDDTPANTQRAIKETDRLADTEDGAAWSPGDLARARAAPAGATGGGRVYVSGYTRKDGTYVQAHTRAAPGSGGKRK